MESSVILKHLYLVDVFITDFIITLFKHIMHSAALILRIISCKVVLWLIMSGVVNLWLQA
jgi:hypothetical protein